MYDVLILGGGPAGLSAALTLGRACKRVVVCNAGPPRNAAAAHLHNFVTRDGTPPAEFRRIAREQLAPYDVAVREARVVAVEGGPDAFVARLDDGTEVAARRVLLATGMVDEVPPQPGFGELWGTAVFQCPYCHGWELRGLALGALVSVPGMLEFGLFLLGWSPDVVIFTQGAFEVSPEQRARLGAAGVVLEERRIARLVAGAGATLEAVELEGGARVARRALYLRPAQRQAPVVEALGLALDEQGLVKVDEQRRTSRAGVWAAGDLTTMMQGAVLAAAAGTTAAAMLNHELTLAGK